MPTHPLWRRFELADLDEVAKARVGVGWWQPQPVEVVPYDPEWPARYDEVARLIRGALGDRVIALSHVGSTSVPGLAAKPFIDVDLTVADSSDEAMYLPTLEAVGFALRLREPDWEEHRLLRHQHPPTILHIFSPWAREPRRHLLFRDWLRSHAEGRELYEAHKLQLGLRGFTDAMDYNNHKAAVVYDLYEKAFADDPDHEHDPRPRP